MSSTSGAVRRIAEAAAAEAGGVLGLSRVDTCWHLRHGPQGVLGWIVVGQPGVVHLNLRALERYSAGEIRSIVFHEVRHLYQDQRCMYLNDERKAEADASEFAFRQTGVIPPIMPEWDY